MKSSKRNFFKDIKIEISVAMFMIVMYFFKDFLPKQIVPSIDLSAYFSSDRLNGIATFFAITIGIYVTVIMVLATSRIGISRGMLKSNLDKRLINVMIVGMIENFISTGLAIFIPMSGKTRYILTTFLIMSIVSFVKFIALLVVIFSVNLNEMAKEMDDEEKYQDDMLTYVEGIYRFLKKYENNNLK